MRHLFLVQFYGSTEAFQAAPQEVVLVAVVVIVKVVLTEPATAVLTITTAAAATTVSIQQCYCRYHCAIGIPASVPHQQSLPFLSLTTTALATAELTRTAGSSTSSIDSENGLYDPCSREPVEESNITPASVQQSQGFGTAVAVRPCERYPHLVVLLPRLSAVHELHVLSLLFRNFSAVTVSSLQSSFKHLHKS